MTVRGENSGREVMTYTGWREKKGEKGGEVAQSEEEERGES